MRQNAPSMWEWAAKSAKESRKTTGKAIGRKHAPQPVPGYERIAELIGKSNAKAKARHRRAARRARWPKTKDGRAYNRKKREILNNHPHESTPLYGKAGRWRPIKNGQGNSPDLSSDLSPNREKMPRGRTPRDTRYGRDLDFESVAQFNARVASYAEED